MVFNDGSVNFLVKLCNVSVLFATQCEIVRVSYLCSGRRNCLLALMTMVVIWPAYRIFARNINV